MPDLGYGHKSQYRLGKNCKLSDQEYTLTMTTDTLREAVRTGRPFKITMADGHTVEIPHPEFAMISGSGRIFYVAKPDSDLFEAFDVFLITGVEQEGQLPSRK
jgi:hypothetical protein